MVSKEINQTIVCEGDEYEKLYEINEFEIGTSSKNVPLKYFLIYLTLALRLRIVLSRFQYLPVPMDILASGGTKLCNLRLKKLLDYQI